MFHSGLIGIKTSEIKPQPLKPTSFFFFSFNLDTGVWGHKAQENVTLISCTSFSLSCLYNQLHFHR